MARLRPCAALFMVLIMLLHGGLELTVLGIGVQRVQDESSLECTCKCCGDVCPMGSACCCGAPKVPRPEPSGLYFRALSCHPNANADVNNGALPQSLTFHFLVASPLVVAPPLSRRAPLMLEHTRGTTCLLAPLSPPPQA